MSRRWRNERAELFTASCISQLRDWIIMAQLGSQEGYASLDESLTQNHELLIILLSIKV